VSLTHNAPFQPRRLIIAPAAVGCKRMLAGIDVSRMTASSRCLMVLDGLIDNLPEPDKGRDVAFAKQACGFCRSWERHSQRKRDETRTGRQNCGEPLTLDEPRD
jgi:hypothetical protein